MENTDDKFNYILNSTHIKHWHFQEQEYATYKSNRSQKYLRMIERLRKKVEENRSAWRRSPQQLPVNYPFLHLPNFKIQTFTAKDESNVVFYFMNQLINMISQKFTSTPKYMVLNYAAQLMRRFYLKQTLLDADAKTMMITCFLLATKLAEVNIDVAEYLKKLKKMISPQSKNSARRTSC